MSGRVARISSLVVTDYTTTPGSLTIAKDGHALVETNASGAAGKGPHPGPDAAGGRVDAGAVSAPRPVDATNPVPAEAAKK